MPTVEKVLNGGWLMITLLVLLALANVWNVAYTALTNARKEKERSEEPLRDLENKLRDTQSSIKDLESRFGEMCREVNRRVDELERGVGAHAEELRDLHTGQIELCRGVQALLEHAIHDGNTDELQASSTSIGKWLRNR